MKRKQDFVASSNKRKKYETQSTPTINTINALPSEILEEILLYLHYQQVIRNVSLVNHRFYNIILNENTTYWQRIAQYQKFYISWTHNVERTCSLDSFVRKYKPSNIEIDSSDVEEYQEGFNFLVETLKLVEPFVTNLTFSEETDLTSVAERWKHKRKKYNRKLFPHLVGIDTCMPIRILTDLFGGSRLKEFKKLRVSVFNEYKQLLKNTSIEELELITNGDVFLKDIMSHNKGTLNSIQLVLYNPDETLIETFEHLSNARSITLEMEADMEVPKVIRPIVFSNLTEIEFIGYIHHFLPLFSVSHPLLTNITLDGLGSASFPLNVQLVPQPQTKSLKLYHIQPQLFCSMLQIMSSNLETLSVQLIDTDTSIPELDVTRFSKIRKLQVRNDYHTPSAFINIIREIAKHNQISKLKVNGDYLEIMNALLPHLQDLSKLSIEKIGTTLISSVLELPKLYYLIITHYNNTFANLTEVIHRVQPHSIREIEVYNFIDFSKEQSCIYLLPPLDRVAAYRFSPDLSHDIHLKWMLFLLSTLNVTKVQWNMQVDALWKLVSQYIFNKNIEYYQSKIFFSLGKHIVKKLKKLMNEVLHMDYMDVTDQEKEFIKNKMNQILQTEQLKHKETRHPLIHELIELSERYLETRIFREMDYSRTEE
jgi:hypothetical protein